MKRIINPEKYLKGIVPDGQEYYIGFSLKELNDVGKSNDSLKALLQNQVKKVIVKGTTGALKDNTQGKYVRKQPEKKVSIWKHIDYYSHYHSMQISYDRLFNIYEKVLLHKYNLELRKEVTPQGETVLIFPLFKMIDNKEHYLKAGSAMNISTLLSGFFMTYDKKLNPIIPVSKRVDRSILPPGISGTLKEKLALIEKNIHNEQHGEVLKGNSYRFAILKGNNPDDVTAGRDGFNDYLIFDFKNHDLLIFENLKTGNATYLFKRSKYNPKRHLDKQNAKKDPAFVKRIVHENMQHWTNQINNHFG